MNRWTMQDDLDQYRAGAPCDEHGRLAQPRPKPVPEAAPRPPEDAEAQAVRHLSAKIGPNLARVAAGIRFVRDSILRPIQSAGKGR